MLVSESTWFHLETYLKKDDRAIIPLGSTEQHANLSLTTDSSLAERVAAEAAAPLGIPVFPVLPYGVTPSFIEYPGTISIRLSTYVHILADILDSLYTQGFRRFAFVNAHAGNQVAGNLGAEWMGKRTDASVKVHNWWIAPKTLAKLHEYDPIATHASWSENFPWTRVPNEAVPDQRKQPIDSAALLAMSPPRAKAYLDDGCFGGPYKMPDHVMEDVWAVAVQETREFLEGPWH